MSESFLKGILPFVSNMKKDQRGIEPCVETIKENGKHDTTLISKINVKVEAAEELTPEAQEEILNEEY